MFKLVTIEDTVLVPSRLFGHARENAIEHMLNKQLSDRVIPDIGLVIAVWDIQHTSDDRIIRNSGASATECRFRVLVFAPFSGEVVFARVGLANDAGLLAYLGFFDPVWVPKAALPRPAVFEAGDRVWVWRPKFDGEAESTYYMDSSTETVVRVTQVEYDRPGRGHGNRPVADHRVTNVMTIKASLYDAVSEDNQGLGDPAWWYEEEEQVEEEEEGADAEGLVDAEGDAALGEEEAYAEDGTGAEGWPEEGEEGEEGDPATDELVYEESGEAAVDAEDDDAT